MTRRMIGGARAPRLRSTFFALLACLIAASLLTGCAATVSDMPLQSERQGLPERAEVPAVPFYAEDDFHNGPAALAMTLAWSGLQVTETDLTPIVYLPQSESMLQADLVAGARRYGRLVVPIDNLHAIYAEIANGIPVLVLQNLGVVWLPKWQYAVAVGYDLGAQTITLNSLSTERQRVPLSTFERTWARADRWALAITPPNRLPISADKTTAVTAAEGLEHTGHVQDALFAYEAIVQRWPESHRGWMALGDARFSVKDYARSEIAYRHAAELKPEEPEAWNNLAAAVARQGRSREAIAHANRAVAAGGPHLALFRQTLEEIEQMNGAMTGATSQNDIR